MRWTYLVSWIVAVGIAVGTAQAQAPAPTPIKSLGEVAGKWDGVSAPSGVKVTLEISDKGAFWVSSPVGESKGAATLEDGMLMVRYTNNQGYLKLALVGGALEGPAVWQARMGTIKFTRAK